MWLCTQYGFYSIVQKLPGEFHVRARLKRDLEHLCKLCTRTWKIHHSAEADYRWRIVVNATAVARIMSALAEDIDYDNFKGRIHACPDQCEKSAAYAQLWAALAALQK